MARVRRTTAAWFLPVRGRSSEKWNSLGDFKIPRVAIDHRSKPSSPSLRCAARESSPPHRLFMVKNVLGGDAGPVAVRATHPRDNTPPPPRLQRAVECIKGSAFGVVLGSSKALPVTPRAAELPFFFRAAKKGYRRVPLAIHRSRDRSRARQRHHPYPGRKVTK